MVRARSEWLPDFCRLPRLAAVIGIAELVVLVIALAPLGGTRWQQNDFLSVSAFAVWIALASALLLCKLRDPIHRLSPWPGRVVASLLPMLVAGICAWSMEFLGLGNRQSVAAGTGTGLIASSMLLSGLISVLVLRYFYVRDQWQAQVQAHAKAAVEALQARIRPHFLFNSMNTIASLVRKDPATAERAVEDLADLFRAALGAGEGDATLLEEVELTRRYLAIEALRLRERLRVVWDVPSPLPPLRLPRLILQPLLENAILHGIARLPEGGEIGISMRHVPGGFEISVVNPSLQSEARALSNGYAQDSIARRLAYHFGPAAKMTTSQRDGYYRCVLSIPTS